MKIGGFQKFSLLDYPGHLAAIVFTQGCNFRCPYCHNPALVDPARFEHVLNTEAVLRFLYRRRKKLGAVVVSGGEPTLQGDIVPFMRLLKAMRFMVKLDTNGSYPKVLEELISKNLVDYIAMDIKAPLPLYKLVSGSEIDTDTIKASMEIIRRSGLAYEFRSTYFDALLSEQDIISMQALLKPGDRFILQECRYGNTLMDIGKPQQSMQHPAFIDTPAARNMIGWGEENCVQISIRSL